MHGYKEQKYNYNKQRKYNYDKKRDWLKQVYSVLNLQMTLTQ